MFFFFFTKFCAQLKVLASNFSRVFTKKKKERKKQPNPCDKAPLKPVICTKRQPLLLPVDDWQKKRITLKLILVVQSGSPGYTRPKARGFLLNPGFVHRHHKEGIAYYKFKKTNLSLSYFFHLPSYYNSEPQVFW